MNAVVARKLELSSAKLCPAMSAGQSLARARLAPPAEFLSGEKRVALICAPAGYGKSMLMAEWYETIGRHGARCGWLSLDPEDNDFSRFLRYLVAALQSAHPNLGNDALAQLSAGRSGNAIPIIESLAVDLGAVDRRIVLFVDDVHVLQNADALYTMHWLANYSPPQVQFVLGSRHEPDIKLSGLRVRRLLCELHNRDLAFSPAEAREFLEMRIGHELDSDQLKGLLDRSEGWAAALELLAAALQTEPGRERLIAEFTGSDRSIVEYLGEAVLDRLEPQQREVLVRVALFDRISGDLAIAVTGDTEAARVLFDLQARNLFLTPLDRHGEWLRLHQLVRDFFRGYWWRSRPEECRATLIAGAHWFCEQGHVEEAVGAAIRAQDWESAASWISASVHDLVYRMGYFQTLMRWMEELPGEWVDRFPEIRLNYAFALAFDPRQQEVEAQLHRLEVAVQRLENTPDADPSAIAGIRCAMEAQVAMSTALRDDGLAAREVALAWLDRWPDAPAITRGHVYNSLAFGYKTSGEIDLGLNAIAEGRRCHEMGEGYYGLSWNALVETVLLMRRGAYREARQVCVSGLEMIDRYLGGNRVQASLLHALMAALAYEFDEIEEAQAQIEQCLRSVLDYGPADVVIQACLTRARLRFLKGDAESGFAILHEGQALAARRRLDRVEATLAAEECVRLGRNGEFDDAQETAMRFGILRATPEGPVSGVVAEKVMRVQAVLSLRDRSIGAAQALQPAIVHAAERGFDRRQVELLIMQALVFENGGDQDQAQDAIIEALRIAAPRQYVRIFLDEGAALAALLERVVRKLEPRDHIMPLVRRLLEALPAADRPAEESRAGVYGELTRRELDLLRRLDSGMNNREIAESVFISEGTLKWHLHNIYGKLGTRNRAGAVTEARRLGLL